MDQLAIDLRSKCPHFRILVVGRANAGKTTLLKKVCNSVEEPEIFGPDGNRLDLAIVEGSAERGEHDIENQLIFKSNRQFIFHDSRGFESGSANEIEKVKDFIAARSATSTLSGQLHAIWYCMPTDTTRPLLAADEQFFNGSGTGKVPVIAIFTKFDGLIDEAFNELREHGKSIPDAKTGAPERAQAMLTTNFMGPLNTTKFRPSDFVRLDDMRMENSDCIDLITKTANALSDDTLRLLFVSVQQNNVDLCIRHAVSWVFFATFDDVAHLIRLVIMWFPHTWNKQIIYDEEVAVDGYRDYPGIRDRDDPDPGIDIGGHTSNIEHLAEACAAALTEKFSSLVDMIRTPFTRLLLLATMCICWAQTFIDGSSKAIGPIPAFATALTAYVGSSTEAAVVAEIHKISEHKNTSTWLPQPGWMKKREEKKRMKRQGQPLIELIKAHRLRFHEERKAQVELANPL